jgi:hypothetical protein
MTPEPQGNNITDAQKIVGIVVVVVLLLLVFNALAPHVAVAKGEAERKAKERQPSPYDNGRVVDVAPRAEVKAPVAEGVSPKAASDPREWVPPPVQGALAPIEARKPAMPVFHHSEDFRVVVFNGSAYTLTLNQSQVMRQLWEANRSGIREIHQSRLYEETDSANYKKRLRDIFKSNMTAFRVLIEPGERRGCFRLRLS